MTKYLTPVDLSDPSFASVFDEVSFWASRFGMFLFRHLELQRGIHVLDVGCGAGFPLFELAHVHGDSCQLTGVDSWAPALARAEEKRKAYGLDNVRLIEADAARLPLPDAHFDLIVSNLGVNNFQNSPAALAECARVAKPQARIVLTTNVKGHMREFYALYRETLRELGLSRYLQNLAENEDHRTTKDSLAAQVEVSGFEIERLIEEPFEMRFVDGKALLQHALTRFGFLEGWRKVVDPSDEVAVFAALEERLTQLAFRSGELRMTVPMLYLEGRRVTTH